MSNFLLRRKINTLKEQVQLLSVALDRVVSALLDSQPPAVQERLRSIMQAVEENMDD